MSADLHHIDIKTGVGLVLGSERGLGVFHRGKDGGEDENGGQRAWGRSGATGGTSAG